MYSKTGTCTYYDVRTEEGNRSKRCSKGGSTERRTFKYRPFHPVVCRVLVRHYATRCDKTQRMTGWKGLYRVSKRNASQEMERKWPKALLLAATGSAWLLFSFPPFPVWHFIYWPGTSRDLSHACLLTVLECGELKMVVSSEDACVRKYVMIFKYVLLSQIHCLLACCWWLMWKIAAWWQYLCYGR